MSEYSTNTDYQGKEWIPTTLWDEIFVPAQKKHVIFGLLTQVPMATKTISFARLTPGEKFTATCLLEAGLKAESKAKTSDIDLTLKKFYGMFISTDEFIEDSLPAAQATLFRKMAQDLYDDIEDEIYYGDGTGCHFDGFFNQVTQCCDVSGHLTCMDCSTSGQLNYLDVECAQSLVEVANYDPNAAIVSVKGYSDLRKERDKSGAFLLSPLADGSGLSAWGLTIFKSANMHYNHGLVGQFDIALYGYKDKEIKVTPNNLMNNAYMYDKTYFRFVIRAAFAILDPAAFAKITKCT